MDAEGKEQWEKSETIANHRLLVLRFSGGAENSIDTSR
jgi:hypothetical protein